MQYILCSILNIKYALRMLCTCDRQARREHMHFEYDVFDSGPDQPDRQTLTDIDRSIFFGIPRPHKAHGKPEALMECPSLRSYMIYHDPTFDSLPSLASGKNKFVTFASKMSKVVTFRRHMKDGYSIGLQGNSIWFLTRIRPWFFQKVIDQRRGRGAKKGSKGILSGTCCRYCVRSHLQFFFKINGRNLALVTTLPETNK